MATGDDAALYSTRGWGPHLWRAVHSVALGYPLRPSEADRSAYRQFFENLHTVLPCGACATNYRRHLLELPLDAEVLRGGPHEPLFAWTVRLHNLVNAELGSANGSDWTPERAKRALLGAPPSDADRMRAPTALLLGVGAFALLIAAAIVATVAASARRR